MDDKHGGEDHNGVAIYLNSLTDDRMDAAVLDGIRNSFRRNANGKLNESELQTVLRENGVTLSAEDLRPLFCKMDVRKEGAVNFLQFVVYVAYELRVKSKRHELDDMKRSTLAPKLLLPSKPIDGADTVERIVFRPLPDETTSRPAQDEGEYVTVSRSGEIQFYTMDFERKHSYKILDPTRGCTVRLTGIVVLPNFNIVCVSTMSGELRFYNATADEFRLCMTVQRIPSTVTCLAYHAYGPNDQSKAPPKIAMGNLAGDVIVFEFLSAEVKENPFRAWSIEDARPRLYSFDELVASVTHAARNHTTDNGHQMVPPPPPPPFRAHQLAGLHSGPVNQVEFCDSGLSFVSVSGDSSKSMACCRVDSGWPTRYVAVADGFWSATTVGDTRVATGGMDGSVRLWDVFWDKTTAAVAIQCTELDGHDIAVEHVFHNRTNGYLYSVSADREIKVWDVQAETWLYTFGDAAQATSAFDYRQWFPAMFNQADQLLAMAIGGSIVLVKCGRDATGARRTTDESHDAAVTKTMYSRLYRVLISVSGADSVIVVWNVTTGQPIIKRTMAHTRQLYGQALPVEITAANFDSSGGLLVTGAANGTVHLWDPNNGACLNRLQIPSKCRISDIVWLPDKILVVGWDRQVTEFDEPLIKSSDKVWLSSHKEVVLSACVQLPVLLVTTSAAGEIGFWRLGTGQLIVKHTARTFETEADDELFERLDIKHRRADYAAVASHFLRARPEAQLVGTLFVALRNGVVQLWCTHKVFSYVARFVAVHVDDDYVTAMASDSASKYLIASTDRGYVKTWYVVDFGVGQPVHVVNDRTSFATVPSFRSRFPFLSFANDGPLYDSAGPLLVNSYRAHVQRVNHVEYIDVMDLVVTSGADKSVRVWTLSGHYVGTLGSPWPKLSLTNVVNVTQYAIPSDIEREGSPTTKRVLKKSGIPDFQTPDVSERLELSKQQSELGNKQVKRKLHGPKCRKQPLFEIYDEIMGNARNAVSSTDHMDTYIDETMARLNLTVNVPLIKQDTVVPKKKQVKGITTAKRSTKKGMNITFEM